MHLELRIRNVAVQASDLVRNGGSDDENLKEIFLGLVLMVVSDYT